MVGTQAASVEPDLTGSDRVAFARSRAARRTRLRWVNVALPAFHALGRKMNDVRSARRQDRHARYRVARSRVARSRVAHVASAAGPVRCAEERLNRRDASRAGRDPHGRGEVARRGGQLVQPSCDLARRRSESRRPWPGGQPRSEGDGGFRNGRARACVPCPGVPPTGCSASDVRTADPLKGQGPVVAGEFQVAPAAGNVHRTLPVNGKAAPPRVEFLSREEWGEAPVA